MTFLQKLLRYIAGWRQAVSPSARPTAQARQPDDDARRHIYMDVGNFA